MGFNNLPETRFEDIKRVLRVARERVQRRLGESERRRRARGRGALGTRARRAPSPTGRSAADPRWRADSRSR
jgi:hypothetical protein